MKLNIYRSMGQRQVEHTVVEVAPGTPLANALPQRLLEAIASQALSCAVWGRSVDLNYAIQEDDRIELLRPLRVDPMTARRERFRQQGVNKAGLFKNKRQGAKAGY